MPVGIARVGRLLVPGGGFLGILGHAVAGQVHVAQRIHGIGVVIVRGEPEPMQRLGIVLPHAITGIVHAGNVALPGRQSGFGRFQVPVERLGIVLPHELATVIHQRHAVHRIGIAGPGRQRVHFEGILIVGCLPFRDEIGRVGLVEDFLELVGIIGIERVILRLAYRGRIALGLALLRKGIPRRRQIQRQQANRSQNNTHRHL